MTDEQLKSFLIAASQIASALNAIERVLDERLPKAPNSSKAPPSSQRGRGK